MKASEEFIRAFSRHGTIVATCACGRTHFASYDADCFDEGELEKLSAQQQREPNKFVEHFQSSVSVVHFGNETLVADCDCDRLKRYENFIWAYRQSILDYLVKRNTRDFNMVTELNEQIEKVKESNALSSTVSLKVPTVYLKSHELSPHH